MIAHIISCHPSFPLALPLLASLVFCISMYQLRAVVSLVWSGICVPCVTVTITVDKNRHWWAWRLRLCTMRTN